MTTGHWIAMLFGAVAVFPLHVLGKWTLGWISRWRRSRSCRVSGHQIVVSPFSRGQWLPRCSRCRRWDLHPTLFALRRIASEQSMVALDATDIDERAVHVDNAESCRRAVAWIEARYGNGR